MCCPLDTFIIECLESVGRGTDSMEKLNSASVYFLSFDLVGEDCDLGRMGVCSQRGASAVPQGRPWTQSFRTPQLVWPRKTPQATSLISAVFSGPEGRVLEGDLLSRINNILCCLCH